MPKLILNISDTRLDQLRVLQLYHHNEKTFSEIFSDMILCEIKHHESREKKEINAYYLKVAKEKREAKRRADKERQRLLRSSLKNKDELHQGGDTE